MSLKLYRMFPKISSASYPNGLAPPKAQVIQAASPEAAVQEMKRRHQQGHTFTTVSDWIATPERP